jgi:hypothetical protein
LVRAASSGQAGRENDDVLQVIDEGDQCFGSLMVALQEGSHDERIERFLDL